MKHQDDYLDDHCNSGPTVFINVVGGKYQEWKLEIEKLSQRYVNGNIPPLRNIMGELVYETCP